MKEDIGKNNTEETVLPARNELSGWSLFLDRDGIINERLPGTYVKTIEEFRWIEGNPQVVAHLSNLFNRTIIVTNQQGIGKKYMTEDELLQLHRYMSREIKAAGGNIDMIYYCTELAISNPYCRKPNPGMAYQAKKDFPEIDFHRSVMIGDSSSDIIFGKNLGMKTIGVAVHDKHLLPEPPDVEFDTLMEVEEWMYL